ncbi:MAG TPA: alpha-L-fucosidase [Planctomycetes bacterium]|nr:alpha-L-fucosidase [Planctomycetota bacterium]
MNLKNYFYLCLIIVLLSGSFASAEEKERHYEPSWESLRHYKIPEWFRDVKYGIFIHWGVYAVPAYHDEWYPKWMYAKDGDEEGEVYKHHRKKYGDQKEFGYKDFIPMFKAQKWEPAAWAELFKKAGARYVVPVAEHHDGFAMYESSHTRWDSVEMGPHRDVIAELGKAVRAEGMYYGVSTHYAHNWNHFFYSEEFDNYEFQYSGLYGIPHQPGERPPEWFMHHWYGRTRELVDKYEPDILWFDFGFLLPEYEEYRKAIAAHYYNKGIEWDKEVVLQFKDDGYPPGYAVLDVERGKLDEMYEFCWQTDTSVSKKSWGYIENDDFKTVNSLVDDLIDIVSKNGCLLLNIGPQADGTIPQEAREILLGIGKWLELNGEAIFETRPWHTYGEGPTMVMGREWDDEYKEAKGYTAEDIRFTTKSNNLYISLLVWPGEKVTVKKLGINSPLKKDSIKSIKMIGDLKELSWSQDNDGLTIQLPRKTPCKNASVLKVELKGPAME